MLLVENVQESLARALKAEPYFRANPKASLRLHALGGQKIRDIARLRLNETFPHSNRFRILRRALSQLPEGQTHSWRGEAACNPAPSESIRLVVERGYADYARSKFANVQARLDDLEQLSQYALRYDDTSAFLDEVALANPIAGEDVAVVGPEDEKIIYFEMCVPVVGLCSAASCSPKSSMKS